MSDGAAVREQVLERLDPRMLIGGELIAGSKAGTFSTVDPATERIIAEVPFAGQREVDQAVSAAREALAGPWGKLAPAARAGLLMKLAALIEENAEELAALESIDNGKPAAVARARDIPGTVGTFRYMAGWATKLEGVAIEPSHAPPGSFHAYTRLQPIGVVAQIVPWNFPLLMAAIKIAPALACGATVVLKPAEQTPLSALRLGELAVEAEIPAGVLNVLTGDGETGALLSAHPGVDRVAFTGSTEVGRKIVEASAGNLKRVSLELGGKSPHIIFADAEVERAIPAAAHAIFYNQGEFCTAGSRLYVHESIYDRVIEGVARRAEEIVLGPGFDAATEMGPLVTSEHLERVSGMVNRALGEGAEAAAGGHEVEREGYYMSPTVIVGAGGDSEIVRDEVFGPVVVATPFRDADEVVAMANRSEYGLGGGLWTRDLALAHDVANRLEAGLVWVNCYNVIDPALPYGGFKQSGWGREMGRSAIEMYTETKTVYMALGG